MEKNEHKNMFPLHRSVTNIWIFPSENVDTWVYIPQVTWMALLRVEYGYEILNRQFKYI